LNENCHGTHGKQHENFGMFPIEQSHKAMEKPTLDGQAPEQLEPLSVPSAAADVWAIGCLAEPLSAPWPVPFP